MDLSDYLTPDRVCFLACNTRDQVLDKLAALLAAADAVTDLGVLREHLAQREARMSTGVGCGIGIPHVRVACVRRPAVAVCIQRDGVPDYETMDGEPVRIVVMIVAGENDHDTYVSLLGEITSALRDESVREAVFAAADTQTVYACLTEHASPAA